MALVSFNALMDAMRRGEYAVGYFEAWNLESLLAVADAAEKLNAPVLLGFSGIYLPRETWHPDPEQGMHEPLGVYAAMGLETCRRIAVPACLVFNESPNLDWVYEAIELGFGMVCTAMSKWHCQR